MKTTRFFVFAFILSVAVFCSSCSWWFTTPLEPGRIEENPNADTDPVDSFNDPEGTGIPAVDSDKIALLGDNLQFFHSPTGDCTIVYNDKNAWAFDYKLNKVTPLVDLDKMYTAADRSGRGKDYFENVTLSVEFFMNEDMQIRVHYTAQSENADAYYKVYNHYALNSPVSERGEVGNYILEEIEYPGSDEPIVIYDIADFEKLGEGYTESWIYDRVRAIIELDIEALEEYAGAPEGSLSEWQSVKISEYAIMNEFPNSMYVDGLSVVLYITESKLERYPAGEYKIDIYDGPGQSLIMRPIDYEEKTYEGTEAFVYTWASRCGGWYPISEQTLSNARYAHNIVDFYLHWSYQIGQEQTYENFKRFCEDTFGYSVGSTVDRNEVENHGGHGAASALCEITSVVSAGNNYIIEVTYFADYLESVVARVYKINVTDLGDGRYKINNCECTFDSGYKVISWSM